MDRSVFVPLTAGVVVQVGGRRVRITHILTRDSFLADDLESGEAKRHRVSEVEGIPNEAGSGDAPPLPDLAAVPEAAWRVAQKRLAVIQPLMNQPTRRRSDVEAAAKAAGVHATTVYDWIDVFERSEHVSSLLPAKRGRKVGSKFINRHSEAIITSSIQRLYLNQQSRRPIPVIMDARSEADKAGLPKPSPNTVRRRIDNLDPQDTMRRRGDRAGADKLRPVPGNYPETSYPYQVIQIDHTPGDIMGLDDADRMPLGRPWITLAIDVFSRMVVGIVIGYERPNAATVGLCVAQLMLRKDPVLAALGLEGDWPACGKPEMILVDNAKEFDSKTFKDACTGYGIGLEFRPAGRPSFGGHIERLMLTTAEELHLIPGTTFSNPKARGSYDPEKKAVMTLDEIERYAFDFFINEYNVRPHGGIGKLTPLAKFNGAVHDGPGSIATGTLQVPRDPARLHLDFMPVFERRVLRQGISIENVWYYDPVLAPLIEAKPSERSLPNGKYVFRRDPRKISPIYFWDQRLGQHVPIHYANRTRPVMSVWQLREAQRQLKAQGAEHVNEEQLMKAYARRQAMIESADVATRARKKDIRRDIQRQQATARASAQVPGDTPNLRSTVRQPPASQEPEEDIFSKPVARPLIDLNPGRR